MHLSHVEMMEAVRAFVDARYSQDTQPDGAPFASAHVVAGLFSPSHDLYLAQKFGRGPADGESDSDSHGDEAAAPGNTGGNGPSEALPIGIRVKLIGLSIADADWLAVDTWECGQDKFVDIGPVVASFKHAVARATERPHKILFVCGPDLCHNCGLDQAETALGDVGVICVARPAFSDHQAAVEAAAAERDPLPEAGDLLLEDGLLLFCPTPIATASSTAVRAAFAPGASAEAVSAGANLLHPDVAAFLVDYYRAGGETDGH